MLNISQLWNKLTIKLDNTKVHKEVITTTENIESSKNTDKIIQAATDATYTATTAIITATTATATTAIITATTATATTATATTATTATATTATTATATATATTATAATTAAVATPIFELLTESSQRTETPANHPIKLWPHQEAMLYRVQNIENTCKLFSTENVNAGRYKDKSKMTIEHNIGLGIMNDLPGSGKTYVILTAMLLDKEPGINIIICPQNIFGQWKTSIQTIFVNTPDMCKFNNTYTDIIEIYDNIWSLQKYKIVLMQDNYAESFLQAINDGIDYHKTDAVIIRRVVVDEIDIMSQYIMSSIKTKYIWLISASYNNQSKLGPFIINEPDSIRCKCTPEFVALSLKLLKPHITTYTCNDDHIQIYDGIINESQMKSLHSGDMLILFRQTKAGKHKIPATYKDLAIMYTEHLKDKSSGFEQLCKELEEIEKQILSLKVINSSDESDMLNTRFRIIEKQVDNIREFYDKYNMLQGRITNINWENTNTKECVFNNEIIPNIISNKESKWLVFNDNSNTLIKLQKILNNSDIKNTMLDGGNQKNIERVLNMYKNGDIQLLLLNSMVEGAGMNLENTTHLVFMHKTTVKFIDQVVGRALRFGRTGVLEIIMLFNMNE